jgi:hypothetical protein
MEDVEMRLDAREASRSSCWSDNSVFPEMGASGIAESDDTVTLGLGGNSEEVDDEGEMERELIEDLLVALGR